MAVDQNEGRDVAKSGGAGGSAAPVVEIACPSCDARYRIPSGAISAKGRRVQCASCGEIWRAMPQSVIVPTQPEPKPEPAPSPAPSPSADAGEGPMDSFSERLARMREGEASASKDGAATAATAATAAATAAPAAEAAEPAPKPQEKTAEKRAEQMAEIRRMLDDLKGGGGAEQPDAAAFEQPAAPATPPPAPTQRKAPPPPPRREEEYVDPLREKLLEPDNRGRRDTGTPADGEAQRAGLMRKHQKRSRRRRVAEKTRKSRGGFMTGLSLIVLVGVLMTGTYVFRDKIAERLPGSGPALEQYAQTVDAGLAAARAFLDRSRGRIDDALGEVLED